MKARCDSCGELKELTAHEDLNGSGVVHNLCAECAEEMYESWDYDKQEPKSEDYERP